MLNETDICPIYVQDRKHQQYLKEHHSSFYHNLILSRKLYSYLADIDTQARNKPHLLITRMVEKEGIKAQNQLVSDKAINNLRNRADELVL